MFGSSNWTTLITSKATLTISSSVERILQAEIIVACSDYNTRVGRAYVVKSSDYRRYRGACVNKNCEFVVNFAFGKELKPPSEFRRHNFDPTKQIIFLNSIN
uniref:AlNc14C86G5519 protein n=1 Tax=Albugo laibachii Nc14 TaxID=890382 RepID=F0WFY6_9STRA|nr:AlNc14C86G5519 [Albugo laibachii Nc14]|eukprot:CCA20120.1 AlNc14C86G5519 [Albugo laibachii Nc14]